MEIDVQEFRTLSFQWFYQELSNFQDINLFECYRRASDEIESLEFYFE